MPGLAESRPSVIPGDKVRISSGGPVHAGFVHRVEQLNIFVHFDQVVQRAHIRGKKYDVSFQLTRTMLIKRHHALQSAQYQPDVGACFCCCSSSYLADFPRHISSYASSSHGTSRPRIADRLFPIRVRSALTIRSSIRSSNVLSQRLFAARRVIYLLSSLDHRGLAKRPLWWRLLSRYDTLCLRSVIDGADGYAINGDWSAYLAI